MRIGYVRVSCEDQHTDRQEALMKELEVEKVFIDRASGKDTARPALQEMMSFARAGDTIYIDSLSRLSRSTRDLLNIIEELKNKQIELVSKKEMIDSTTPTGRFMIGVFGCLYAMERENTLLRQAEGIKIAKEKGMYKGRKPIHHPDFERVVKIWKSGSITAVEAMKRLNMKPSTFYRKVREMNANN